MDLSIEVQHNIIRYIAMRMSLSSIKRIILFIFVYRLLVISNYHFIIIENRIKIIVSKFVGL